MDRLVLPPDEGEPNAAECFVHNYNNKYLVRVLVVLLHARFSVVGPIPFLLAAFFFLGHPYIGSTTVLPDIVFNIWPPHVASCNCFHFLGGPDATLPSTCFAISLV